MAAVAEREMVSEMVSAFNDQKTERMKKKHQEWKRINEKRQQEINRTNQLSKVSLGKWQRDENVDVAGVVRDDDLVGG